LAFQIAVNVGMVIGLCPSPESFTVNELRRIFGVVYVPGAGRGDECPHAPVRQLNGLAVHHLCPPGTVRPTRTGFFEDFLPARSEWIARPAGQGFMSTQRRDNRWRRTSCTGRTEGSGKAIPGSIARHCCANASGGTAPPEFQQGCHKISANGLPYRTTCSVCTACLVCTARPSPRIAALRAGPGEETGTPAIYGLSLPHIPSPSGLARLHPTLRGSQQADTLGGKVRWQRKLYLQYAARNAACNS